MKPRKPATARTTPSFVELFTPKLVTVLREGYSATNLRSDAFAGLTVAIVALPLSMAIAIASGATPAQGLYTAIVGGFLVSALGSLLFIHRMSRMTAIETAVPFVPEDRADTSNGGRLPYDEASAADPDVVVYRISDVFFFGAAASIGSVLDRIDDRHRALVIDLTAVAFLDSTAANTLETLAHKAHRRGIRLVFTGTTHEMRQILFANGIKPPLARFDRSVEDALRKLRRIAAVEA